MYDRKSFAAVMVVLADGAIFIEKEKRRYQAGTKEKRPG
jgi:hypothetical protein